MSRIGKKVVIADNKTLTRNDIITFSIHTCINVTTDQSQYILSYGEEKDNTPPITKPAPVVCLNENRTATIVRKLIARHEKERHAPFPSDQEYYVIIYDNMIDVRLSCSSDDYSKASVRAVTGLQELLSFLHDIFHVYYETSSPSMASAPKEVIPKQENEPEANSNSIPPMTEEIMRQKTAAFENAYRNLAPDPKETEDEIKTVAILPDRSIDAHDDAKDNLRQPSKIVSINASNSEVRDGAAAPDSPTRKLRDQMQHEQTFSKEPAPMANDAEEKSSSTMTDSIAKDDYSATESTQELQDQGSHESKEESPYLAIHGQNTLSIIDYVNSSECYVEGDPNAKIREVLDATFKAFNEVAKGMFLANERTPEEIETFDDLLSHTKTQFMSQIADQLEFEAIVSYKINENTTRHEVVMVTASDQKKAKDKVLSMIENRTLQLKREDADYNSLQFDRLI